MPFEMLRSRSLADDTVENKHQIIAPMLSDIINVSLESATVLAEMKHALVTPLLKKTSLYLFSALYQNC
jgi:hypothetical protein